MQTPRLPVRGRRTTVQTSAATPETSVTTPAYARFKADRLKWVYAARANVFDPRPYLQNLLVEPAPEGGVYIVAANGQLMLVAYDAEGTANSRFTFDVIEEIANICGFPADEQRLFSGCSHADTIVIEGDTLKACRTLMAPDVPPLTVLSQPVEIGHEFPDWQPLIKASGPCNPIPAYVDLNLLELAFVGLEDTRGAVSLMRHSPEGKDATQQGVHINFETLPLRGLLISLGPRPGNPPLTRHPMPFDAA